MVIASLPVFDLGLVFLMSEANAKLFEVTDLGSMVLFYLVVLAYSYVLFGILLAVASGLAAMYLRGQLVYDILHTQTRRQQKQKHALAKNKSEGHAHKVHR